MKVYFKKYTVVTKDSPMEFESTIDDEDELTDRLEDAMFFGNEQGALNELSHFNNPDNYKVIPVTITYEI